MTKPTRTVEFDALPPTALRRFVEAIEGKNESAPIASWITSNPFGRLRGVVSLLMGAALSAYTLRDRFGDPSQYRISGFDVVLLAVPMFMVFWGVYEIVASLLPSELRLPEPGTYLFPSWLVRAKDTKLELLPTSEIESIDVMPEYDGSRRVADRIDLEFTGGHVESLRCLPHGQANAIVDALRLAREALRLASSSGDRDAMRSLDVFFDAGGVVGPRDRSMPDAIDGRGDGATGASVGRKLPWLVRNGALVAIFAPIVLAWPLAWKRNVASDDAAFARLTRDPNPEELESYIATEGRHAQEARAMYSALVAYEAAEGQGTLAALGEFARRFPGSREAVEARAEIRTRYARALDRFLAQAPDDPALVSVVRRMLAYAETHAGSPIPVRFVEPSDDAEASAPRPGTRTASGDRPVGVADSAAVVSRRDEIVQELSQAFMRVFGPEILVLENGGGANSASAPDPQAASIEVQYVRVPTIGSVRAPHGRAAIALPVSVYALSIRLRPAGDPQGVELRTTIDPAADDESRHRDDGFGALDQLAEMERAPLSLLSDQVDAALSRPRSAPARAEGSR